MACRVALICALTVWVTSAYGTPEAAISAYVVFFLNQPDRVLSVVQGLAMLVLVTLVVALITVVALFVLDDPVWRVACIAGLSLALLFVTSANKLRPVGAIVAMIVGFTLDELGSVPFGEAATRALLYAWVIVAIPIGVSICVNLTLAPSPRRLAGRELAKRLRLAARCLAEPDATHDALGACLLEGDAQISSWLALSAVDGSSARADIAPPAASRVIDACDPRRSGSGGPRTVEPAASIVRHADHRHAGEYGRHARGGRLPGAYRTQSARRGRTDPARAHRG